MRRWTASGFAVLGVVLGTCVTGPTGSVTPAPSSPAAPVGYSWADGVSCLSAKDCVAVGARFVVNVGSFPLAERWNGKSWQVLPVRFPAGAMQGGLAGVSCKPGGCVAVGAYSPARGARPAALAESWNGAKWYQAKLALPAGATGDDLTAVSA